MNVAKDKSIYNINLIIMLTELLGRKSVGDQRDLEQCKQDLYHHSILAYCSAALKFNPAKIEGDYVSLTQMADIIR